ncbi:MAG: type III-A CRISPR-associated protein Csm2 [Treponema sp. CETP13]|nr:MAG: type III-A CRISPR-associated protein Csm2 [Treponema sp. CETP13]
MANLIGSFYSDMTKKTVKPELFDTTAKHIASTLAASKVNPRNNRVIKNGVSSTQLRRLFDEIKSYERILKSEGSQSWDKYYPYVLMIKSKTAYSVERSIRKNKWDKEYYKALQNFINDGIDLIKDETDYHVFVALFEAVYGFYYENAPKD